MVKPFFEALKAEDLPGELWGNVESFRKTSPNTRAPADFARFRQQIEVIRPLTEGLVTFDFYHYMNPTGHCCENDVYQRQQKDLYDAYRRAF